MNASNEQLSPEMAFMINGLLRGPQNSKVFDTLRVRLRARPEGSRKETALQVRLMGASRKDDIIECLIVMAQMNVTDPNRADNDDAAPAGLSCITEDIQQVIAGLPAFDSVSEG